MPSFDMSFMPKSPSEGLGRGGGEITPSRANRVKRFKFTVDVVNCLQMSRTLGLVCSKINPKMFQNSKPPIMD